MKKFLASLLAFTVVFSCLICPVSVSAAKAITVKSIRLSQSKLNMTVGDVYTLRAKFNPVSATNKAVKWASTNSKIATVKNGKVSAKAEGICKITAISNNNKKATCFIEVQNDSSDDNGGGNDTPATIDVTSISLSQSSMSLKVGESMGLSASITPESATNTDITWTVSEPNIITTKDGKVVALKAGTCVITAKAANGLTATCNVTVTEAAPATIKEFQDYLNKTYKSVVTPCGTMYLTHTISENGMNFTPYDYWIQTDWNSATGISPLDVQYSIKFTDAQKVEARADLRNVQKSIYQDAIRFFPNKKFKGGYYSGFYDYPNLKVGYESIKALTWINYTGDIISNYNSSTVSTFRWCPEYDDYDFTN